MFIEGLKNPVITRTITKRRSLMLNQAIKKCAAIFVSAILSHAAIANEMEVSLSEDHIDFRFTSDFDQDFMGRFAIMHAEEDDGDANVVSYTFGTRGERDGFDISLGGRAFWIDAESENALGLALGFGVAYEVLPRLKTGVEIYYSPDILTSGDLDSSLDIEARASYKVIDNGSVFVGFRRYEIEDDNGADADIVDGVLIGMRLTF